jgi:hypothetical protein
MHTRKEITRRSFLKLGFAVILLLIALVCVAGCAGVGNRRPSKRQRRPIRRKR